MSLHSDRMSAYQDHVSKYGFSSLRSPVAISSIASLATKNNSSINNDKKMIYPLRVTEAVITDRHVDLLLYECNGIQHYTPTSVGS